MKDHDVFWLGSRFFLLPGHPVSSITMYNLDLHNMPPPYMDLHQDERGIVFYPIPRSCPSPRQHRQHWRLQPNDDPTGIHRAARDGRPSRAGAATPAFTGQRRPGPAEQHAADVVAGYTLLRQRNKVLIVAASGKIVAEKEVNGDRHYANFLGKFRVAAAYRRQYTGAAA